MFLSVLIPTKDQSEKTLKNLKGPLWRYFEGCGVDYEVLICMDGSGAVDRRALEAGMRMLPDHFRLLPYESKKGKGHNVRRLIEEATGDYVLFMDCDLATDLESFTKFRPYIDENPVIIASRYKEGAEIPVPQSFLRRLMGKGSRFARSLSSLSKGSIVSLLIPRSRAPAVWHAPGRGGSSPPPR